MSEPWTGGCLCGAVRYRATVDDPTTMNCFCRDCQRATGSTCATFFGVPLASLELTGPARGHAKVGDSGGRVERFFCSECGSQLYSVVEVVPGMAWVKTGSLDDPGVVAPKVNIWTRSRSPWAPIDPRLRAFEAGPTR
jgi:hypothetical protein